MVPGPPMSLQLLGLIVLVISLNRFSSMVLTGPRWVTPGLALLGAPALGLLSIEPDGWPTDAPPPMANGPVTGEGGAGPDTFGWALLFAAMALRSPKFSTGMTRSATG